jgi:hypothetical protein
MGKPGAAPAVTASAWMPTGGVAARGSSVLSVSTMRAVSACHENSRKRVAPSLRSSPAWPCSISVSRAVASARSGTAEVKKGMAADSGAAASDAAADGASPASAALTDSGAAAIAAAGLTSDWASWMTNPTPVELGCRNASCQDEFPRRSPTTCSPASLARLTAALMSSTLKVTWCGPAPDRAMNRARNDESSVPGSRSSTRIPLANPSWQGL